MQDDDRKISDLTVLGMPRLVFQMQVSTPCNNGDIPVCGRCPFGTRVFGQRVEEQSIDGYCNSLGKRDWS